MSWFGNKSTSDTKARIEELKKKIQAEQSAYSQSVAPPAVTPPPPPAEPVIVAQPAPVAPPAPQPVYVQPVEAPVQVSEPKPVRQEHRVHTHERTHERPMERHDRTDSWPRPREQPKHHEHEAGVILDIGDGLSLNLPIRSRMQLDEFLLVAQRVRELQRLQH